ncbi:MAG: portal protein, partial [Rhodanobacter sp.]
MIAPDPSLVGIRGGDRRKIMDEFYDYSSTQCQQYWNQSNIDRRMAIGDQRVLAGLDGGFYQTQKFVFNILHQYIQMVSGHQRKNRKSSICIPLQGEQHQQVADDYTATLMWVMKSDNMLHKISEAFKESLTTGMCFMHRWLDTRQDPKGVLRLRNYSPTTMLWDPWWRERDLSDCRGLWTRDFISEKQLHHLLGDVSKELSYFPSVYNSSLRFSFMPESYQVRKRKLGMYAYDQFYYMEDRAVTLIHSYSRGETYEVKGDEDTRRMWIDMNFSPEEKPYVEEIKTHVPAVNLAISVNDRIVYDEFFGDKYPFTPMLAFFDPDSISY